MSKTYPLPPPELALWANAMETCLRQNLQASLVEVIDESAAHAGHAGSNGTAYGSHFKIRIASPLFIDQSRVSCHRLVYDSLRNFIDQGAHALAIEVL